MKVFISWSGDLSKDVALLLRDWLKNVLQATKPWMSDVDTERGAVWFNNISGNLTEGTIGIICLTEANKNNPWILFEAGALLRELNKSRVCPLLIDLDSSQILPPLSQFQHTKANKEDVLKLIQTLNDQLAENKLEDAVLLRSFEAHWPEFEKKLKEILSKQKIVTAAPKRDTNDILKEILEITRSLQRSQNLNSDLGASNGYTLGDRKNYNALFYPQLNLESGLTRLTGTPSSVGTAPFSSLDSMGTDFAKTNDPLMQIGKKKATPTS